MKRYILENDSEIITEKEMIIAVKGKTPYTRRSSDNYTKIPHSIFKVQGSLSEKNRNDLLNPNKYTIPPKLEEHLIVNLNMNKSKVKSIDDNFELTS